MDDVNQMPIYEPGNPRWTILPQDLDGEMMDVIYRQGNPGVTRAEMEEKRAKGEPVNKFSICAKPNPRTYEAEPGIICEQDACIILRDGTKIYADIYRPNVTEPVPLIVSWGPFGKRPSEGMDEWKMMGVPPGTVSTMAKYESADPGYWCRYGYAVANVDPRGVGNSDGNVTTFSTQDGRDGYDFIEWAAQQWWCNGKTGMFGNSGVGMVQWRIAAERPPHLSCIAVWEGTGDMYRESLAPGGIPCPSFNEGIIKLVAAKNWFEDACNMLIKYPLINKYWEDKIPKWSNIRIPTYVCAGWCHIHLHGSIEGFRRIRSAKKWLRCHREMEWPDTYHRDNLDDLRKFYDRYLKDIRNGWEFTPRIRMNVMDAYDFDTDKCRCEKEFPIKRTEYRKIYLDAESRTGSYEPFAKEAEVEYDPEKDVTIFNFQVPEETEIIGFMKLHLNLECRGHDNTDLFIWVKKTDKNGNFLPVNCLDESYRGVWGYFRGSHRELDPEYSTDFQPVQAHRKEEPMEPGKIYPVDIEIWPTARVWHKGEYIRLEISGKFIVSDWFEDNKIGFIPNNGNGKAVIHTGGQYDSYLQIPFVPPKYVAGDGEFIYR